MSYRKWNIRATRFAGKKKSLVRVCLCVLQTCLFVIGNAVMEFERTIVESKKNAYKDKLDVHCLHVLG